MPERIPQSVAITVPLYAVLSSDHITPATGKTIAVTISKNTAGFGNPSVGATNATEIASGWYYVTLSTTDTGTAGPLIVLGTNAATDNVTIAYNVVNANTGGLAALPDTAVTTNGSLLTSGTGTAQLSVSSGLVTLAASQTFSMTGSITGSLSGSVGSVTGAVGSVSTGGIVAATFASGALDAVWSTATRVLTAGTNIVLPSNGLSSVTAWTVAITGNITGNLSGSVGSVTAAVGIDWNAISNKTAMVALTNTTISAASSPTAAQIATAVWQDATAGDFTVSGSIGKSLFTAGVVPGASGGLFIAGSNAATTVSFTGSLSGSVGSVTSRVTANVDQIDGAAWGTHATGMAPADLRDILGSASVGAAGYVGIDWAQIANKTATVALTNTTISGGGTSTPAQIATAVWQDITGGDFSVVGSIGYSLFTGVAPGSQNGLFIAGNNYPTNVTFTGTFKGSVQSVTDPVRVQQDQQMPGAARWSKPT